jgi:hypothetical protein
MNSSKATKMDTSAFIINCTGDVCTGDTVLFTESVFGGSYRRPSHLGDRRIIAKVVKDSYGADKQQHTFSLEVINSDGYDPIEAGTKTRRKGRNVYRNGIMRMAWENENARQAALDEKHGRGRIAREARDMRRAVEAEYGFAA